MSKNIISQQIKLVTSVITRFRVILTGLSNSILMIQGHFQDQKVN